MLLWKVEPQAHWLDLFSRRSQFVENIGPFSGAAIGGIFVGAGCAFIAYCRTITHENFGR